MTDQTERLKKSVRELSATQREIEAELRAEDAAPEYERVLVEYAGRVKLKGFRASSLRVIGASSNRLCRRRCSRIPGLRPTKM